MNCICLSRLTWVRITMGETLKHCFSEYKATADKDLSGVDCLYLSENDP